MSKKKKGLFLQVWSDDDESYIFDSEKQAIENAKETLEDKDNRIEIGTTVKIFDLTKLKPIKEMSIAIKSQ